VPTALKQIDATSDRAIMGRETGWFVNQSAYKKALKYFNGNH